MKTAICISGHVRNWRYTYPNFKEYILDHFSSLGKVDIFISTWDTTWTHDCWSPQYRFLDDQVSIEDLKATYQTEHVIVDHYTDLRETFKVSNFSQRKIEIKHISENGVLFSTPMFYKIWSANNLKKKYEQEHGFIYDVVIRYRFDLWFREHIEGFLMENLNHILIKSFDSSSFADDTFAFGSSKLIDIYSDLYTNLPKLLETSDKWGPERLLYKYLQSTGIKVDTLPRNAICICRKEAIDTTKGISGEKT